MYYNKNIYLAVSAVILILGLIFTYFYVFQLNYVDMDKLIDKLIFFTVTVIIAGATFCIAFIKSNSWKNPKMEMKI
jgi:hypothetical protein